MSSDNELENYTPITKYKRHETLKMNAVVWYGKKDVRMVKVPVPMLTEETDAIIKVTLSSICGSDLDLYHNEFSGILFFHNFLIIRIK
jgi:D-arabinose 1-dehydrogenase-like Zn-dependent alcohol dehydrogenase